MNLRDHIRDVPDFPKPGILFRDITPLLQSPEAMAHVEAQFMKRFGGDGITHIAGIESRGFIFGTALARAMGVSFVPVRKAGKLPGKTVSYRYSLEYGEAEQEIHLDAVSGNDRVLIVDDLLATGGTAEASVHLIEQLGASVAGLAFVIELGFLGGRAKLPGRRVESLVIYD